MICISEKEFDGFRDAIATAIDTLDDLNHEYGLDLEQEQTLAKLRRSLATIEDIERKIAQ